MAETERRSLAVATSSLIVLTMATAAVQTAARRWSPPIDVPEVLGSRWVDVVAGEWWRLLTGPLVSSAGWDHALLNAAGLLLVARPVERAEGTATLLILFWCGSVGALVAGVYDGDVAVLLAGGSGGVVGLAGYILVRRHAFGPSALSAALIVIVVTFVALPALGVVVASARNPGGLWLHVGGLATGLVAGLVARTTRMSAPFSGVAVVVLTIALLIALTPALRSAPGRIAACAAATVSDETAASDRTRLQIVNETGSSLRLFWVSYSGELRYGTEIRAESSLRRNRLSAYTHAGAQWLVTDALGRCLVSARARTAPSIVTVRSIEPLGNGSVCRAHVGTRLECVGA